MFRFEVIDEKPNYPEVDALGKIVVNDFEETFGVSFLNQGRLQTEAYYLRQLRKLIEVEESIAIHIQPLFIWCFWREGETVYLQEQVLLDDWEGERDSSGFAIKPGLRSEVTEDGDKISQWQTCVSDIRDFLNEYDT